MKYKCETCGYTSTSKDTVEKCESKPVSGDKGVKVGDTITIAKGEGRNEKAIVTRIFVYDINWGHSAWERYWHTIGIEADIIDGFGSRQLPFDSYEVIK